MQKLVMSDRHFRANQESTDQLRYEYVKSPLCRTVRADDCWVSITPHFEVQIAICSESFSLPQKMVYHLNPDGSLGDEILEERIQEQNIIREVEVNTTMTIETARALIVMLEEVIGAIEIQKEATQP